jgi:hypothetical protein
VGIEELDTRLKIVAKGILNYLAQSLRAEPLGNVWGGWMLRVA